MDLGEEIGVLAGGRQVGAHETVAKRRGVTVAVVPVGPGVADQRGVLAEVAKGLAAADEHVFERGAWAAARVGRRKLVARVGPVKAVDEDGHVLGGMDGVEEFVGWLAVGVERERVDKRVGAFGEDGCAGVLVEAAAEVEVMGIGKSKGVGKPGVVAAGEFAGKAALVAQVTLGGDGGVFGGELADRFFVRQGNGPVAGEAGEVAAAGSEDKFPSGMISAGMRFEGEAELEQCGALGVRVFFIVMRLGPARGVVGEIADEFGAVAMR